VGTTRDNIFFKESGGASGSNCILKKPTSLQKSRLKEKENKWKT
jgi:hypothetical protein